MESSQDNLFPKVSFILNVKRIIPEKLSHYNHRNTEHDAIEAISQYFDCSEDSNEGKGARGGLTKSNINVVFRYTGRGGGAALELNPHLRELDKIPANERKEALDNRDTKIKGIPIKRFIRELDDAISKVELPADLILYRGLDYWKLVDDLGYHIEKEVIYRDAAFMSTAYLEKNSRSFTVPYKFKEGDIEREPIFVFKTKPGQCGAVSHHEHEVILPRGITLQCLNIIDVENRRYFIMDYLCTTNEMEV